MTLKCNGSTFTVYGKGPQQETRMKTNGKLKHINVRIPASDWKKLSEMATTEDRTLSGQVRFIISRFVKGELKEEAK